MPQQHVHDADEAHRHAVVHSHVDFHQHEDTHHPAAADHDRPEIGTDNDGVVWVNGAGVTPRAFHFVPSWEVVNEVSTATPTAASTLRQPDIEVAKADVMAANRLPNQRVAR